jgi:probable rRNA maturation factor
MLTINSTLKKTPHLQLAPIADAILGANYDVTCNFIGTTRARTLNETTRGKSYVPNVLSFPLTDTAGEVYLCPTAAAHEAADFHLSPSGYLTYLFIHGCLHLAGYDHGPAMDTKEAYFLKHFSVE